LGNDIGPIRGTALATNSRNLKVRMNTLQQNAYNSLIEEEEEEEEDEGLNVRNINEYICSGS
jgi:hypothetical protein